MLRVIIRVANCGAAANVGGPVNTTFKTFDIYAQEVEDYLKRQNQPTYNSAEVIGVEIVNE